MKNIALKSLIYTLLSVLLLGSCQNEAIEVQKQIKVTISPSGVLDDFVPFKNDELEMYEDDELGISKLRITALLYDSEGKLVSKNEELVNNYESMYSCSFFVDTDKDYTLLCFSSAILGSLAQPELETYVFTGIENIATLKVTQVFENSYYSNFTVLGTSSDEISTEQDHINVMLQPATAFIYLRWLNVHANTVESDTGISGTYGATATDYWGEDTYSWEIEIERTGNDVVVKNLSPFFADNGITADNGANIYRGYIDGDYIVIPQGQQVGFEYEGRPAELYGVNRIEDNTIYVEDIYIKIGNNKLTIENGFATYIDGMGWLDLFNPGVVFNATSNQVNKESVDKYYIIYHNNDIASYDLNDGYYYRTSLSSNDNNARFVEPALYPDAKNIYESINLLPGEFNSYARLFIGNDRQDYSKQTIEIEAGKQYMFVLDCETMELKLIPGEFKSDYFDGVPLSARIKCTKRNYVSAVGFEAVRFNGFRF